MRLPVLLLALLTLAAPAVAQTNDPRAPLPDFSPDVQEPLPVVEDESGDGLSTWQEILIFGGGAILLGGIALIIIRDARRRAPVTDAQMGHPALGNAPKHNRSQKQRERARAAARVARKQRKRNRRR